MRVANLDRDRNIVGWRTVLKPGYPKGVLGREPEAQQAPHLSSLKKSPMDSGSSKRFVPLKGSRTGLKDVIGGGRAYHLLV
jgi:hypothetical protein